MEKWTLQHREVMFSNEYVELIKDNLVTSKGVVIPDYYSINTNMQLLLLRLIEI